MKIFKFVLCMFFLVCLSCQNKTDAGDKEDDQSSFISNDKRFSFSEEDDCNGILGWSVRLKLKPQADKNYLATEDPEFLVLVSEYDVILKQTYPSEKSTPELLLYYDLTRKDIMSWEFFKNVIYKFLDTGKFEDYVYVYGISFTT